MLNDSSVYPLEAARTLALHTQGLAQANPPGFKPGPADIEAVVRQIGAVQIDTLQMVQRSQYLVLWSRLGTYNPADFERLMYDPARRVLYEDWLHAASIVPLTEFRYSLPRKRSVRQIPSSHWLAEGDHVQLMSEVLERIRQEGPLRTSHFKHNGPRRGAWWDWTPAKHALEWLFAFGDLMVSERVNFQRVYDLTERVLPDWVDTSLPTPEEVERYLAETAVRCLGICGLDQAATYSYRNLVPARAAMKRLLAEGVLQSVQVELLNGQTQEMVVHHSQRHLLEQAANGAIKAERTTFLSFFDNLFWAKGRDEQFWGFKNHLEAYTPAPKRAYGYFSMPILHRGRIVGQFDPKLERKQAVLRLRALHAGPGVILTDELLGDMGEAMRDFMRFHKANQLVVEASQPEEFGRRLLAAL